MSSDGGHMIELFEGDCIDVLAGLSDSSVHAIVTDPPYALTFMGRAWDRFEPREYQAWCERWSREALRVLKPGGHMLAFGGTRTCHRLVTGIEDAGFEVRDMVAWLYGSGFPKSLDVSKAIDKAARAEREVVGRYQPPNGTTWNLENDTARTEIGANGHSSRAASLVITAPITPEAVRWAGWGTALKPAMEPIVLARKPLSERTVAANVLAHGTGAMNIDACRIEGAPPSRQQPAFNSPTGKIYGFKAGEGRNGEMSHATGRWPANVLHDGSDEVEAAFAAAGERTSGALKPYREQHENATSFRMDRDKTYTKAADSGTASRFYYTAKADGDGRVFYCTLCQRHFNAIDKVEHRHGRPDMRHVNTHPTVKPIDLLRWLVRLITPPGGTVLDMFAGTGTTGEAAMLEGFDCILIERDAASVADIRHRLSRWSGLDAPLFLETAAAD